MMGPDELPPSIRHRLKVRLAILHAPQHMGQRARIVRIEEQGVALADADVIECRKSELKVKLFKLANRSFFDVLRTKLKWGER